MIKGGRGSDGGGRQWWGGRKGGSGGAGPLVFVPGRAGRSFARCRSLRGLSCPGRLPLVSGGSSSSAGHRGRCRVWAQSLFVGLGVVVSGRGRYSWGWAVICGCCVVVGGCWVSLRQYFAMPH